MTAPINEPVDARPVATGEELAELLSVQHADLRDAWSRVPQLHGCAREDVFLHARRLLAVHVVLERVVLGARLGGVEGAAGYLQADLDRDVVAAERQADEDDDGSESPDFEAACARVAAAFSRHAEAHERVRLTGPLPEADRQCVGSAVALWDGAGDAYLGNTWAEMVEVALAQVSPPSD